jgi:hypothetical protein
VPSPKVQDQDVGFPIEASENCTFWLTVGDVGDVVKAADGAFETDVVGLDESEDPPPQALRNKQKSNAGTSRIMS